MLDSKAYACVNEHYPRIADAIKLFWGHRELVTYIDGLLMDSRPGARQGFPLELVESLTNLLHRQHADFPQLASEGGGIWITNNKVL